MRKGELGQEPAYPCEIGFENGNIQEMHQNGNFTALHNGMSKRFYAALEITKALASNPSWVEGMRVPNDWDEFRSRVVNAGYEIADELLKQENE